MPRISLAAVVFEPLRAASGIFEDEGAAIAEGDFLAPEEGANRLHIEKRGQVIILAINAFFNLLMDRSPAAIRWANSFAKRLT
jgi:hypothetical protein